MKPTATTRKWVLICSYLVSAMVIIWIVVRAGLRINLAIVSDVAGAALMPNDHKMVRIRRFRSRRPYASIKVQYIGFLYV